ncbi:MULTISPECIES: ferrous iron transport protein B [Anaerotruncus]|uniref:ferrous iron transport protein B n=2 Tax=Oscillospiraceae TaxID=216572 RepID=UPI00082D0F90|nr:MULTISPECIES: ferrous iron transport protein B [Anaerotruncus]RGX56906.1 ferrous iron transport protein B [Anaerotruncus sp. AF02-27]
MIFALAGNQNCGKTTLFNQLTGSNQHVGNFPGVTVERKVGAILRREHGRQRPGHGLRRARERMRQGHEWKYNGKPVEVVDLPGIYSLSPYTNEEIVTRDFLLNGNPDGIINIVDATNIERNLYLSMQLIELGIPMVIALNMMDEVRANGGTIKIAGLAEDLGVPVVPISAVKNEGIGELIDTAIAVAAARQKPKRMDFCSGAVHRAIHATAHLVEDHAERVGVPSRFAATKLVEGDTPMMELLQLSENEKELLEHNVAEMEQETGTDREAALADMRYTFIESLCHDWVVKSGESKEHLRSLKMDEWLTHKYFALPIFLCIMMLIFWLTFGVIGSFLSDLLAAGIDTVTAAVSAGLTAYGINPVVHSLVIDGVFAGVGSVLSFLPIIVVLFFFLSILEDSGYMARVAFVMDKLLRKIGLSGRSFVPMLIGFGCSVPAIMATRTLASERDRRMTILLTPFMSCSAKLPIYGMFTVAFFPEHRALVMIALYILGMLVGILSGLILKNTVFHGQPVPFVMELPNYRLPGAKSVCLLLWDKAKDFLTRAFTVIFVATIIIWFLQTFDTRLNVVAAGGEASMLASIGRFIAPVFAPLGFTDWRASTALITGFSAKEAVVSTLAVLTGTNPASLPVALQGIFTPLAAGAFLVFTLLYTPCVAAIAAVRRELNTRSAILMAFYQSGIAWLAAFVFYQLAGLFIH